MDIQRKSDTAGMHIMEYITLFTIFLILGTIVFLSLQGTPEKNYRYSVSSEGQTYYTNFYKIEGSCINFTSIAKAGTGTSMIACGTYKLTPR